MRGDVVMTLGAGDVWKIGPELLASFSVKSEESGMKREG